MKEETHSGLDPFFHPIPPTPPLTAMDKRIKPAPADSHHPAEQIDVIGLHLLPDEAESQFDSLAKKGAAFFNISRSISNRFIS